MLIQDVLPTRRMSSGSACAHQQHGYLIIYVLIKVFRILEDASTHNLAWSLKLSFPCQDLLTEETKIKQRQYQMKKHSIGFKVNSQRGITLEIQNEIMQFNKDLFV